jgi:hypothetical protein
VLSLSFSMEQRGRGVYPRHVTSYPQLSPPALYGLARDMIMKGWQPVWCLARQSGAFTPIPDTTGGSAPYPKVVPQPEAAHRLAFRPPPSVVIFDVDHYDGKMGKYTIDKAEAWLGDLPDTWRVTSRGVDNPSGRYLFRKPVDLDFTDSALHQFADDDGHTSVEIVRTSHRFSWAPGDVNHKNGLTVECFDPMDDKCDLPDVSELPELPEAWVTYLSNPPIPQSHLAYTRPSDGPEWWLSQADQSLGTRAELAQFAFDMLASRMSPDFTLDQLRRVSLALNPGEPWEDKHLIGLVDANTQQKVGEIVEREQAEYEFMTGMAGGEESARRKYEQAEAAYQNKQLIRAEIEVPFDQKILDAGMQGAGIAPVAEAKTVTQSIRSLQDYEHLLFQELARTQARKDAAKILAGSFSEYESIADLPEPPPAQMLFITGSNGANPLIPPCTITSLSGPRASGKSWAAATWAAQEMTQGHYVFWVDFERQAALFNQKLNVLGVQRHIKIDQLKYTSILPPAERLCRDIAAASQHGFKRVLLVVDAFRGLQALVAPGTSANDGDAVEAVYMEYLNPAVEAGATVVLLDHLPKAGGATFGSERKESAPDYVIKVEQLKAFTKSQPGFSSLLVTKDRYGVMEADTTVGYLWMPGDGSESGSGVTRYPDRPEFRSWAPEAEGSLDAVAANTEEADKEHAVLDLVRENPLRYGPRDLGRLIVEVVPGMFSSDRAATAFADRMVAKKGLLDKDGGKYILKEAIPSEVHSVTPDMLIHPEH